MRISYWSSDVCSSDLSAGCTTTRAGSKNCETPRPSQPLHAPTGELKENRRGSSSGNAYSHTGQLYFDENSIGSADASSIDCTVAMPSPSLSAVSNDSARRCLLSSRTLKDRKSTRLNSSH